ncbi:spaetzle domain-containing protein [Trichonephila clavipes]|nr:spaetzle domain-containing protein [Trichonephila clavipes]
MGTSFLQEVSDNDSVPKPKSEASTYLSNHPLLTGATAVRSSAPGCNNQRPSRDQQSYLPDEDDGVVDGFPFGRPRRRPTDGPHLDDRDECQVRFGLHYSSCFSKYKDFDDKFDELQHHVQSLPRGGGGATSPCSTLQLLAKVAQLLYSIEAEILPDLRSLSWQPVPSEDAIPHVQRERRAAVHRARPSSPGAMLPRGYLQHP